jgi:hypothetical protein
MVVAILLGALRNNDPTTNDGIKTAWNFSARNLGSVYPSFVQFLEGEEVELFFTYQAVQFREFNRSETMAWQVVTLTGPNGETRDYLFALTLVTRGEYEGCWRLAAAVPTDTPRD